MLFVIRSGDRRFAVDISKIDIIQIEDNNNLGAEDRYALCFYRLGEENAVEFILKRFTLEQRIEVFEAAAVAKKEGVAGYYDHTI